MAAFTVEYRMIGLLPTCIGNERIRITPDGQVFHSRNTRECEPGQHWSDELRVVGTLDPARLAGLVQKIRDSGVLTIPTESIDDEVQGGTREELDLTIDQADYHFVVQNAAVPAFRAAVRTVIHTVQAAGAYPW